MGRKTFDTIKNFTPWPYSKKVFVLSNSIKYVNSELNNKVSIVNGDIKSVLSDINKKGFIRLYIDGGKTIQSFLELNLIDELIITKAPVLLGRGIPLFNKLSDSIQFQHLKTEVLDNTFVKSHYIRNKTNMHL